MRKKLLRLIKVYHKAGKNRGELREDLGLSRFLFWKYIKEDLDESTCNAEKLFNVKERINELLINT